MNSEDYFEELICGLSFDRHFVRNPIVLPDCGHSACKNCLSNDVKCKICAKTLGWNWYFRKHIKNVH